VDLHTEAEEKQALEQAECYEYEVLNDFVSSLSSVTDSLTDADGVLELVTMDVEDEEDEKE
jgi:hypothetical protein